MPVHKTYTIDEKDGFDIACYPEISNELAAINRHFAEFSFPFRADIVISYLKDHSIKKKWVDEHAIFVEQLTSFARKNEQIESLFAACRTNKAFVADLEMLIRRSMKKNQNTNQYDS